MLEALAAGARALGLELTPNQDTQFTRYLDELVRWNRRANLTSAAALADAERVHFLDSLTLVPLLRRECPDARRLIDVGAGAGFPGLPIKLVLPQLHVVLVEATAKKAEFLRWVIAELGLEGVEVHATRAELAAHDSDHREAYDVATARALGPLPLVLELTLPFCRVGGMAVAPRAGDVAAEVEEARGAAVTLGGSLRAVAQVRAPGLRADAALAVADKVASTPSRYPRRTGALTKRPLSSSRG